MRAITLHQPYATLMARGYKRVETRGPWATQLRALVGEDLAITAAARPVPRGWRSGPAWTGPPPHADSPLGLWVVHDTVPGPDPRFTRLPLGAVVAVVRVAEVLPIYADEQDPGDGSTYVAADDEGNVRRWTSTRMGTAALHWSGAAFPHTAASEAAYGDYGPGRVAVLTDTRRELAEPIPCRGYQRVWTLPDDVAERVQDGLCPPGAET